MKEIAKLCNVKKYSKFIWQYTCWTAKKINMFKMSHRIRAGAPFLRNSICFSLCLLSVLAVTATGDTPQGLTAYGEPCTDPCKQRGFPYTWCHKKPSRNGTWIDRDYCSTGPGVTRYQEPCQGECARRNGAGFYACQTRETKRGDWDYCSPFRKVTRYHWTRWWYTRIGKQATLGNIVHFPKLSIRD